MTTSTVKSGQRKKKSDFASLEEWTEFDRERERRYDSKRRLAKKEFYKTTTLEERREERNKLKKSAPPPQPPAQKVNASIDTLFSIMNGLYHSDTMSPELKEELKATITERLNRR